MTAFLFSWANAPFTTALLVVAFYVLLQLIGLVPWAEGADAGVDADAPDVDAGHLLEAGGDADADVDADVDASGPAHEHGGHGPAGHGIFLGALGVGKVPTTVIWQTLLTMFGLAGTFATAIAANVLGGLSTWLLLGTMPVAGVVGFVASAAVVRVVARLVPTTSGRASTRRELVGCLGVVISSRVTPEFGEVRLKDRAGRVIRVVCYVEAGRPEPVEGAEVIVTEWEADRDRLYVTPVGNLLESTP